MNTTTTTTTGNSAHAATTGYQAHAATTGDSAHAATTGGRARAATTGYQAHAATTGDSAHAATTGNWAHAATTGNSAHAATTGNSAHAFAACGAAESAQAIAIGRWVRLGPDTIEAVVLPAPGFRSVTIAADIIGVWITMTDNGIVVCRPDVLLPDDGRGYQLTFVGGRYVAGCRKFAYDQAVSHWSNPSHQSPESARMLLTEVKRHHAGVVR